MKKNKEKIALIIGNIIIYLALIFLLYLDKKSKENIYLNDKINQLKSEFLITKRTYDKASELFYNTRIKNSSVIKYCGDFSKRSAILNTFYDDYRFLRKIGFDRFIFTLPDGTVYLRMHNFDRYGDKISEIAEIANYENNYLSIDKNLLDSLVYLYPIFINNKRICDVYLNVPFYKISDDLANTFNKSYLFIIKKDFLNLKENKGYIQSDLSPDYFVESKFYNQILKTKNNDSFSLSEINKKAKKEIDKKLREEVSFSYPIDINGNTILMTFMLIKSFNNIPIGYLISYEADTTFKVFSRSFYLMILSLLFIMIIINIFIINIIKLKNVAEKKAITDKLTGLFNRSIIDTLIQVEIERAKRNNKPISILLFDIDHFKKINDTYGHDKGDYALKTIAEIARRTLRKSDYIIRWGGEEFLVILPETDLDGATKVAEKIRSNIENYNFKDIGKVTVSIGVTTLQIGEPLDNAIKRADEALYAAKNKGRNRVEVSYY
jgi:diguanylate cyclase (GGDEF)-like protein